MCKYAKRVERYLKGIKHVSTGASIECDQCKSDYNIDPLPEDCTQCYSSLDTPKELERQICKVCWDEMTPEEQQAHKPYKLPEYLETSSHFSWSPCEICGAIAGDRQEWHGIDSKSKRLVHGTCCTDCVMFLNYGDLPS